MQRTTLSKKLLTFILPLLIIPILLLLTFYYTHLRQLLTSYTIAASKSILLQKSEHITKVAHNKHELQHCIEKERNDHIPYITIIDENMQIIADVKESSLNKKYQLHNQAIQNYFQEFKNDYKMNLKHNKEDQFMIKPLLLKSENNIIVFAVCDYKHIIESKLSMVNQTFIYIFFVIVFITFISLILTIIFSFNITYPIQRLIEGSKKITQGDLDHTIDIASNDEVGLLVDSFNTMTGKRKSVENELYHLNQNLEIKIKSALSILNSVIENTSNIICYKDSDFNYMGCNSAFETLIGHTKEELIGRSDFDFLTYELASLMRKKEEEIIKNSQILIDKKWVTYPDGKKAFLHITSTPFFNLNKETIGLVCNAVDITEEKLLEDKLEHQAQYDDLTKIPNRSLFMDRLEHALNRRDRHNSKLAVFFMDLDKFKLINDVYGHHYGDIILQEVAQRLSISIRKGDTVGRLGGDEFAAVIDDVKNDSDVFELAKKLIHVINGPIIIEEHSLKISLSIGIALYKEDGISAQKLLSLADEAMYLAKKQTESKFAIAKTE